MKTRRTTITERTDLRETKVDRERRIIRDVKILGLLSANGRRYTRDAIKEAASLYEGKKVRANHPQKATATRDVDDTLGWFEGVEIREDGLYAREFHYLESHPLSARIVEAAERNPKLFGFSHNIQGDTREETDGSETVVRITEVRSVDLVDDPATTGGLFEGVRMKFREFLESIKVPSLTTKQGKRLVKRLFEAGIMDDDMSMDDVSDMPADDAPAEDHVSALKAGFRAACIAVLDGEGDVKAKMGKLKDILQASEKLLASGEPVEEEDDTDDTDDSDDSDDDVVEEDDEDIEECDDEEGDMKKKVRQEQRELRQLRAEKRGRQLCEAAGVVADSALLEALGALPEEAQKKLIEREKSRSRPASQQPRSGVSSGPSKGKSSAQPDDDLGAFIGAFRSSFSG